MKTSPNLWPDEGKLWNLCAVFMLVNTSNIKDENIRKSRLNIKYILGAGCIWGISKIKIPPFRLYLLFYTGIHLFNFF